MNNYLDWNEFTKVIAFLKNDIDELYFRDVIKASTSHNIEPFNQETLTVMAVVENWISNNFTNLSNEVVNEYNGRANELGNFVEKKLREGLSKIPGVKCVRPSLANGKIQSSGYPDCLIEINGFKVYADVKTYQTKTCDSNLRSFFYQPTNNNKIHFEAPHCIIGFETESLGGDNKSPFKIIGFKIVDVFNLKVKFKAEFNAGNSEIYSLNKPG